MVTKKKLKIKRIKYNFVEADKTKSEFYEKTIGHKIQGDVKVNGGKNQYTILNIF